MDSFGEKGGHQPREGNRCPPRVKEDVSERCDGHTQTHGRQQGSKAFQLRIASGGQGAVQRLGIELRTLGNGLDTTECGSDPTNRQHDLIPVAIGQHRFNLDGRQPGGGGHFLNQCVFV